jgi:hypothetical protein
MGLLASHADQASAAMREALRAMPFVRLHADFVLSDEVLRPDRVVVLHEGASPAEAASRPMFEGDWS